MIPQTRILAQALFAMFKKLLSDENTEYLLPSHQSVLLPGMGFDIMLGLRYFYAYYKHFLRLHLQLVTNSTISRHGNCTSQI